MVNEDPFEALFFIFHIFEMFQSDRHRNIILAVLGIFRPRQFTGRAFRGSFPLKIPIHRGAPAAFYDESPEVPAELKLVASLGLNPAAILEAPDISNTKIHRHVNFISMSAVPDLQMVIFQKTHQLDRVYIIEHTFYIIQKSRQFRVH